MSLYDRLRDSVDLIAVLVRRLEWHDLSSISEDPFLKQLRHLAINGGLKVSKFRSVAWSLLLGVLSGRSVSWLTQRRCDRNRYFIAPNPSALA